MKKIFFALAALVLAFTGCSQEEDTIQVSEKKAVKVVVNMDKPGFGEDTRAARQGWEEGDVVGIILNDDFEHVLYLTYSGTTWVPESFFLTEVGPGMKVYTYDEDDEGNPTPAHEAQKAHYFSNINPSGNLKAIYCSSGLSYFDPIFEDDELVGTQYLSIASEDGIGECIMTCDKGDNGTYTVSEGVLTLNITMKPRVAQYTIRNLNVANGWSIAIHGPVNFYAGACFTEEKIVLTPIEYALYGYPHQNGNDISIFAAPWQSNADIPDFMLEELPPDFEMPVNMYQTVFYEFTVNDEGSNVFGREFDYKAVGIGGAVIMDGPYTEDEDGNKTTGAQEWI
jgi:hypothetical protein